MEKIVINGKEFNLNTARAQELGVLTPVKPAFINPRYGDVFGHGGHQYILAAVTSRTLTLIQIDGHGRGSRYTEPVSVTDINKVTESEWNTLTGNGFSDTFSVVSRM